MSSPNTYPLIFKFREHLAGDGFVAEVAVCGRVLARKEDDGEWWLYGVAPGAMAEGGGSLEEAYARFSLALRNVFSESATAADSFAEFERSVQRFVGQVDPIESERWSASLESYRSGREKSDAPISDLPRLSADFTKFGALISRVDVGSARAVQGTTSFTTETQLLRPAA